MKLKILKWLFFITCLTAISFAFSIVIAAPLPVMTYLEVYGKVIDAYDNKSIPNATVKAQIMLDTPLPVFEPIYIKTSSDGSYKAKIKYPKGITEVHLFLTAYKPKSLYLSGKYDEYVENLPKVVSKKYIFALNKSNAKVEISGYVYEGVTGEPIPNLDINAEIDGGFYPFIGTGTTDASGYYYMDFEIDYNYYYGQPIKIRLYKYPNDYKYPIDYLEIARKLFVYPSKMSYTCDMRLSLNPKSLYFHGRITDIDGKPIPYVHVTVAEQLAGSGGSGNQLCLISKRVNADWLGCYRLSLSVPQEGLCTQQEKIPSLFIMAGNNIEIIDLYPEKDVYTVDFVLQEK